MVETRHDDEHPTDGGPVPPPLGLWSASLALGLAAHDGRTELAEREHSGPLQVQRAFYPEGPDLCHVYVLHPPGGLVGGDQLSVRVRVERGARALVTTPAAGKAYRARDERAAPAAQRQRLDVAAGGSLEWLPQETIVFDGARVELETRVELEGDAAFVGWEILCLGRPASGERFGRGACRQRFEVWREGRPLCLERARLEGGGEALAAAWGMAGAPVAGTLIASPAPAGGLDAVRALAAALPEGDLASATLLDGALVCRYLGAGAQEARGHFLRVWAALRPALLGRPPVPPRIWST